MKMPSVLLLSASLLAALSCNSGFAAEDQIVIEDLTPAQLRAEIEKIQTEFYRVYNRLNEDDAFDIDCHEFLPTGSNIPQKACEPKFMIKRRSENVADYQAGTGVLMSQEALLADLGPEMQQLTQKMNAVARDNEYFRDLNQILKVLQDRLKEITP